MKSPHLARMARHLFSCLVLAWIGLCLCSMTIFPGRARKAESWLPADSVAVISAANVERSRERWEKTAMGKAWADTTVEYWRTQQLDPVLDEIFKRAGIPEGRKVLDLITGEVVVAVEIPRGSGNTTPRPALYAIADFGRNSAKARRITERGGPAPRSEKAGKVSPIEPGRLDIGTAWVGDRMVVACPADRLQSLLDRAQPRRFLFFGKTRKASPSLPSNPAWREMSKNCNRRADVYLFVDLGRVFDVLTVLARQRAEAQGMPLLWLSTGPFFTKSLGLDGFNLLSVSSEMREKAFYTRAELTYREGATGLLMPSANPAPLQTPQWATRDIDTFAASRIRPPLEMKTSLVQALVAQNFLLAKPIKRVEKFFEKKAGVKLDTVLGAFGSEVAVLGRSNLATPDFVLLWEIRDTDALEKSLKKIQQTLRGTSKQNSFSGLTYEIRTFPRFPFPIYTAQIGNFFMLSLQERWLKEFASRRQALAGTLQQKLDPARPAGPNSLLPLLEAPFRTPPKDMVVVGRSYQNPAPGLLQLNAFLPLAIPFVNLQLMRQGAPTIPLWVTSAIPPLLPFANNAFPTVRRTMQKGSALIVQESYSAFNPLASPLAAAALVIASKHFLGSQE